MSTDIEGEALTSFEVAADGSSFRMYLEDKLGRPASVSLPTECLNRLLMTLPSMVASAVQRRHRDRTLRVVYPVEQWTVELSADRRTRILTLQTPDGFAVSFGLTEDQCREIGGADAGTVDAQPRRPLMN